MKILNGPHLKLSNLLVMELYNSMVPKSCGSLLLNLCQMNVILPILGRTLFLKRTK